MKIFPRSVSPGFTLMELITVIAILGVLAAFLIPTFSRGTESSRSAKCVANLKGLYNGIALYMADNNNCYPPAQLREGSITKGRWSMNSTDAGIGKYIGDVSDNSPGAKGKLFICPDHPHPVPEPVGSFQSGVRSYAPNQLVMKPGALTDRLRAAKLQRPSQTILLGDATIPTIPGTASLNLLTGVMSFTNPANADNTVPEGNGDGGGGSSIAFRHGGKANLIFCDGHVESLRPDQVKQKNFSVSY